MSAAPLHGPPEHLAAIVGPWLAAKAADDTEALDLIVLLRAIERGSADKPRIGKSRTARDDCVTLGQEPYAAFPAGNVAAVEKRGDRPHVTTRFLGLFGPQGALPLATTLDAIDWRDKGDPAFLRFTEIVSNRFLQLFFRAFADARAIAQNDRPLDDRFYRHLAAVAGLPQPRPGAAEAPAAAIGAAFAGLLSARAKTPAQLSQLISGALRVDVRVVERVPTWLIFEAGEQTRLGAARSSLGRDTALGSRQPSIADKVAIEIRARDLAEYRTLLPGGRRAGRLGELVFLALGRRVETEIRLGIPAHLAPPIALGEAGELGLTAWVSPAKPGPGGETPWRLDARYVPAPTGPPPAEEAEPPEVGP
ncbi:type VI secretion system baseplate subunit TssG [Jiella pacifica]|uniref:Type VI secretion system baseplate subunit TssG n=1 Tax=Jiella pacifica TaxID=2696469 RepID=A0A6N9SUT9_9HYPH|nr:type VI secretion system baseplate subunit TssG [Jiella pacifica]NDW02810.1 type VI secretion system baseplate subunit TssG [Jiella pacifica]